MKLTASKSISAALTGVILATTGASAAAQVASHDQLKQQIDELQKAVQQLQQQIKQAEGGKTLATTDDVEGVRSDLENYKYDQDRLRERNTVKSTRDATLFGTVQLRAQAQSVSTKAGNPAPAGDRISTFDVPTAQLGVRGSLYRDYVDGKNLDFQLSLNHVKRPAAAGAGADLNLHDAFVRYNVFSTNGDLETPRLNVTLGQQSLPFGLEAQAPEDLRPTINVATAPSQFGLFGKQVGVIVRGDIDPYVDYAANYRAPLLEYAFGIVNGGTANKVDNNNGKDFIARVAYTLPVDYASWLRELKVGATVYQASKVLNAANTNAKSDVYGFDIYYNHAPFGATYEYFQGKGDFLDANGAVVSAKPNGQTLTLFYTLGDQFFNSAKTVAKFDDSWPQSYQFYYRNDRYNPNNTSANLGAGRGVNGVDKVTVQTLGLNWFFAQTTKVQFGLNHYKYGERNTGGNKSFNELQAQVQYTF